MRFDNDSDNLILADHRIWLPTASAPMDFGQTVESYLRRLQSYHTRIGKILADPYQMRSTIVSLQQAGLPAEEFNQTTAGLTEATEELHRHIANRRILLYEAADLRQHCLNAVATETGRGIKLSKERQSLKIDDAVALSFAVLAAVRNGKPATLPEGVKLGEPLKTNWVFDPRRQWG